MKTRLSVYPFSAPLVRIALALVAGAAITAYLALSQRHLNLPALGLILGGTLIASCMSYPASELKRLLKRLCAGSDQTHDTAHTLAQLTTMARLWAQNETRKIDHALATLSPPILRTGVQLLINQTPAQHAQDLLHARIARWHTQAQAQVQMLRAMAGFASALGVLGTIIGLVNIVAQLGSRDMASVGPQLAVALLGACYGLACAALIFRPLALRLERHNQARLATMQLVVQGITMMFDKRGPNALRETLQTLLDDDDVTLGTTVSIAPSAAPSTPPACLNARPARLLHGSYATSF